MQLNIDIYATIIFLGIVQGLFLFYVFARYSTVNKANIYFSFFILSFSLICLEILFNYIGLTAHYLFLVDFSEPLNFCIAPLFYIYLRQNYFNLSTNKWLHLSLALVYFFYSFLFWLQPDTFKHFAYLSAYDPLHADITYTQTFPHDPLTLKANLMEIMIIQMIIYFFITVRLFQKHNMVSKAIPKTTLYKRVILLSAVLIGAIIFVRNYFDADLGDHFLAICTATFIYYISYLVYTKSTALNRNFSKNKYSRSALGASAKEELQQRIVNKLEYERLYLDSNLTLARFARALAMPSNQLSQIINECFQMNFNELMNSYRIKEAQKHLIDPDKRNIKIEEIGYNCGFNSKSTFFTAFKKYSGVTPTDFRDSMKKKV